jgi:allantoate deiminase
MTVTHTSRADQVVARCREIAACTEVAGEITRTFLSPTMRDAHALLRGWMEAAGMSVRVDSVGNLRGLWAGATQDAPRLLIGSHLDTVPNAGAFDGVLGVVMGVAVVEALQGKKLSFAIEVIGFSEEEGVRFRKPFLGSFALVGKLDAASLALTDAAGVSVTEAIEAFGLDVATMKDALLPRDAFAYLEFHIEQGPVLESEALRLGVVTAIAGQDRLRLKFEGAANHAGTTPMHLRHDAMAVAAEWIVAVEQIAIRQEGLVATVGSVETRPGAGNVIAGEVTATLDLRHADDATRATALDAVLSEAQRAADKRRVRVSWEQQMHQAAAPMDTELIALLKTAVRRTGETPRLIVSGAGHDAMVMAEHLKSCMLFLRSPGGVSHHPSETVLSQDVEAALAAGLEFLNLLDPLAEAHRSAQNI